MLAATASASRTPASSIDDAGGFDARATAGSLLNGLGFHDNPSGADSDPRKPFSATDSAIGVASRSGPKFIHCGPVAESGDDSMVLGDNLAKEFDRNEWAW